MVDLRRYSQVALFVSPVDQICTRLPRSYKRYMYQRRPPPEPFGFAEKTGPRALVTDDRPGVSDGSLQWTLKVPRHSATGASMNFSGRGRFR